jgi:hypothetical protein
VESFNFISTGLKNGKGGYARVYKDTGKQENSMRNRILTPTRDYFKQRSCGFEKNLWQIFRN